MIHELDVAGSSAASGRLLAVIAGQPERAQEVAACFARQGDRVKAVWYPSTRQAIEAQQRPRFEAVILFAHDDTLAGDVEEAAVRGAFQGTPLYRL